jgi:hypothetical protein
MHLKRNITMFTATSYWSLVCATWIQSIPLHLNSLKSILILPSHLCPSYPSGSFLHICLPKSCMHPSSLSYSSHAPHIISSLIWSSSYHTAKHKNYAATHNALFSHLLLLSHPNTFLNMPFLNNLRLSSSLILRYHISGTYKTMEKWWFSML